MNEEIVIATVEDWTGRELVAFEGDGCAWKAIGWREDQATSYANSKAEIDTEEWEEAYNGQSEDLYVVGYDEKGEKKGVQFG